MGEGGLYQGVVILTDGVLHCWKRALPKERKRVRRNKGSEEVKEEAKPQSVGVVGEVTFKYLLAQYRANQIKPKEVEV